MPPAVYQLLAFPGTGKYTVAKAMVTLLEARGEPVALLDNHATHNLVWPLVPKDARLTPKVLDHVFKLRAVLLEAAAEVTSPDHSIIFTNFLPAGRPTTVIDPQRELAARLDRPFVAAERILALNR